MPRRFTPPPCLPSHLAPTNARNLAERSAQIHLIPDLVRVSLRQLTPSRRLAAEHPEVAIPLSDLQGGEFPSSLAEQQPTLAALLHDLPTVP